MIQTMSGKNPPIPTTTKGFKIFPRTYRIWTRANLPRLLQALRSFPGSVTGTAEFLSEWELTIMVYQLELPNNYHIEIQNLSFKEVRTKLASLLINLKKENIISPREGATLQTPHKTNIYLDLQNNQQEALKALITGYRSDQETFSMNSTNIRMDHKMKEVLHLPLPLISKEDELLAQALTEYEKPRTPLTPLKSTPQKRPHPDKVEKLLRQIQLENCWARSSSSLEMSGKSITCDTCKPHLWHTTLDNNKEDSDYDWEEPIPTTTKGFKIYPRTYLIWTRAKLPRLLEALRSFPGSVTGTAEFLSEWEPTIMVYQLDIPNNYHIEIQNMTTVFCQAAKKTDHTTREPPRIYHKLGQALFCDIHKSSVWCNKCILLITWCTYWGTETITCETCKPHLWHTTLDNNKDNSDYEWEEPTNSDNDEELQDLPKDLFDMDESQPTSPPPSTQELPWISDWDSGVPERMGTSNSGASTGPPEQLPHRNSECEFEGNQNETSSSTDKPQEGEHNLAKRRRHSPNPAQNGHLPISSKQPGSSAESPHHRIPFRPRKLLPEFNKHSDGPQNEGMPPSPTPSHLERRRTPSPSFERIRKTKNPPYTPEEHSPKTSPSGQTPNTTPTNSSGKLGRTSNVNTTRKRKRTPERKTQQNRPKPIDVRQGSSSGQDQMDARRLEESETDQQTPFYTFVIRERPAPRQRGRAPDFTCADHGDHWHITFQSAKSNVPRKRNTICKFLGLGNEACLEASASTTLIKTIKNWILYLIRYGLDRLQYFGTLHPTFRAIINYFKNNRVTGDDVDGPCPYRSHKRTTRAVQQHYKDKEYDFIHDLLQEKQVFTIKQLLQHLNEEEFRMMWITLGNGYKEKIRNILQHQNQMKRQINNSRPIMLQLNDACTYNHKEENVDWLYNLFAANNIDVSEFFAWFIIIGDKKLQKINTFVIKGPTGTGKTLTLATLLNKLNTGTITRFADTNQFHLQNLLSRNFALFEEPRIGVATVDEYKLLLEGSQFEINVKNSDMEQLHRIPIFISTNREIDYWVPPADGQALQSRCKTFELTKEIKGMSDRAMLQTGLDPPPGHISLDDFLQIYRERKETIDEHVRVTQKHNKCQ
ncbi:hypothetical protein O3P69_020497 [Scylla paramamosain]|uniref:SF3 helicase domain-containing protein n=1 Tax=Scylla paramamosain TaxID=85552 RepID=A0AAW0TM33_SCYPA